jgi:hypothetical protein
MFQYGSWVIHFMVIIFFLSPDSMYGIKSRLFSEDVPLILFCTSFSLACCFYSCTVLVFYSCCVLYKQNRCL